MVLQHLLGNEQVRGFALLVVLQFEQKNFMILSKLNFVVVDALAQTLRGLLSIL